MYVEEKPAFRVPRRKARRPHLAGRPMTADDPMTKLIGSATDAPPTDSSKKYEYLADTLAPERR
jgi:hypothetical protein